jgi:hypothetical protein
MEAVRHKDFQLVKMLISLKADVNIANHSNDTAVHIAAMLVRRRCCCCCVVAVIVVITVVMLLRRLLAATAAAAAAAPAAAPAAAQCCCRLDDCVTLCGLFCPRMRITAAHTATATATATAAVVATLALALARSLSFSTSPPNHTHRAWRTSTSTCWIARSRRMTSSAPTSSATRLLRCSPCTATSSESRWWVCARLAACLPV